MFPKNGAELLERCEQLNTDIGEIAILSEMEENNSTREEVIQGMKEVLEVMKNSSKMGTKQIIFSVSGIIGGDSTKLNNYVQKGATLSGDTVVQAMSYAMSSSELNASMGKIVAAPTAGACGILPSVLMICKEKLDLSDEEVIQALAVAGGIGIIIGQNATISGAEGGCQAETGSAAAMAAGAAVYLMGGSPQMCLDAGAIVLMNLLGLVCDPVAGLVELPCAFRNAQGAVSALTTADMIMAGVRSRIPFDECVDAMFEVGKSLNETLRETGIGGIAGTPTGKKIKWMIFGDAEINGIHKDYK